MLRCLWLRAAYFSTTTLCSLSVFLFASNAHAIDWAKCDKTAAEIGGDIAGGMMGVADAFVGQKYGNDVCVNPNNGVRYSCYNPNLGAARFDFIYSGVSQGTANLICEMTTSDQVAWELARDEALKGKSKNVEFDASYDPKSKVAGSVEVVRIYKTLSGRSCRDVVTHLYNRSDRSESGTVSEMYCMDPTSGAWEQFVTKGEK